MTTRHTMPEAGRPREHLHKLEGLHIDSISVRFHLFRHPLPDSLVRRMLALHHPGALAPVYSKKGIAMPLLAFPSGHYSWNTSFVCLFFFAFSPCPHHTSPHPPTIHMAPSYLVPKISCQLCLSVLVQSPFISHLVLRFDTLLPFLLSMQLRRTSVLHYDLYSVSLAVGYSFLQHASCFV